MSDNQFSEASDLSDAVLVVEEKRLHVSKTVLSLASPVFDRMFHGDFEEGKTSQVSLPGKKYDHVVEFLSCIYISSDTTVTRENMDIVMPLAEEYQVAYIKNACDTFIETMVSPGNRLSTSELVHMLNIAGQYELPKSMKKYAEVAATRRMKYLQEVKEFEQIDPEVRYGVASRRLAEYENGCNRMERSFDSVRGPNGYCKHRKIDQSVVCNNCKDECFKLSIAYIAYYS